MPSEPIITFQVWGGMVIAYFDARPVPSNFDEQNNIEPGYSRFYAAMEIYNDGEEEMALRYLFRCAKETIKLLNSKTYNPILPVFTVNVPRATIALIKRPW
jgi:hypothetical protein